MSLWGSYYEKPVVKFNKQFSGNGFCLKSKTRFFMGMKWIRLGRDDKSHKEVSQQTL